MSPRLFCNLVYAWLTRNASPEDKQAFDDELYADERHGDDLARFLMNLRTDDDEGGS